VRVRSRTRGSALIPLLALALPLALPGQTAAPSSPAAAAKPLTLEAISGPHSLVPQPATGVAWRDAGRVTWLTTAGHGKEASTTLWQYDTASGRKTVLLAKPMLPAAKGPDGKDETPKPLILAGSHWSPSGTLLLATGGSDLWLWDFEEKGGKELRRLTNDADGEEYPVFSPDGSLVAYVKKNDLWVFDLASGRETRLTTDGSETVLNGKLDWVYEEELANRRSGRSFEWAPDSKAIAYLRLDDSRVPEYPIVDYAPPNGSVTRQLYPNAGDPNPVPSVHVVGLDGKETASYRPQPEDVLVAPELSWTPDSKGVSFLHLDRVQTKAKVFLLPREGGAPKHLLTESDPAWINAIEPPRFLKDGSGFLFVSERTGFLHLYRYAMDGTLRNAVTKGDWMIDGPVEVDEKAGAAFFASTAKDPRERQVCRANLDGSGFSLLAVEPGTHSVLLSPSGRFFASSFSSLTTPPVLRLRSADGAPVAALHEPANPLAGYALGTVEMGSFRGADGTLFYTSLVKPSDFDPAKKYPATVFVYGGPHAQVVRNAWTSGRLLDRLLASKGILVWSMDNRGAWGRGHAFETPILKRLGTVELADQLAGIAELKKLPYVDGGRLGVRGWSYGGFMALTAATHAGATFRCAVAGAPVAAWRLYDSIYTERYMKLPKENPEGYAAASPLEAAGTLGTRLLILHGTSDDNVHLQNTILFADALMKARKDFDFVPLPRQPHGPRDPDARLYADQRIVEFLERSLLGPP
jgi:dipeptidyl-peptidase-4